MGQEELDATLALDTFLAILICFVLPVTSAKEEICERAADIHRFTRIVYKFTFLSSARSAIYFRFGRFLPKKGGECSEETRGAYVSNAPLGEDSRSAMNSFVWCCWCKRRAQEMVWGVFQSSYRLLYSRQLPKVARKRREYKENNQKGNGRGWHWGKWGCCKLGN